MLLFLNVGGSEVMVIALFVLMFFGSKQIPELMRGLGKGMREMKDAMNGIEREVRTAVSIQEETKTEVKTEPSVQIENPPQELEQKSSSL